MKTINELMKETIKDKSNFTRLFKLTNGTAVNNFKNGKSQELSDTTYEKIGANIDYKMIKVMVPIDTEDTKLESIKEFNDGFIEKIRGKLDNDKSKVKEKTSKISPSADKKDEGIIENKTPSMIPEPLIIPAEEPIEINIINP